jgi:GTP diphosphokinase / guanosine-3',5'-bis(diphosphate) 3'-diphosphatase
VVDDQKGVLAQMAQAIADADANIESVQIEPMGKNSGQASIIFALRVANTAALARVIRDLRILKVVRRALRVKSNKSLEPI